VADHQEQRDKLKELADEFRLKAHLASMDAKTLWEEELEPKLRELDHQLDDATRDIDVAGELRSLERKLRELVESVIKTD